MYSQGDLSSYFLFKNWIETSLLCNRWVRSLASLLISGDLYSLLGNENQGLCCWRSKTFVIFEKFASEWSSLTNMLVIVCIILMLIVQQVIYSRWRRFNRYKRYGVESIPLSHHVPQLLASCVCLSRHSVCSCKHFVRVLFVCIPKDEDPLYTLHQFPLPPFPPQSTKSWQSPLVSKRACLILWQLLSTPLGMGHNLFNLFIVIYVGCF